MGFPNYPDKHAEEAFVKPEDFAKSFSDSTFENAESLPEKYILIYYPTILDHFIGNYEPKEIPLYRLITIYTHGDVGVVHLTGIGSPHAVTVFEELISLGGREFINIGSAGGLNDFGVFLCEKAIRDEGTSSHYEAHGKYAHPSKELTARLEKQLNNAGISFQKGISWTVDAPYRETKAEIEHYRSEGVSTVEMEASALFTVADFRGVDIASAFVVSDLLGSDEWDPQFDSEHVNQKLNQVFDSGLKCLIEGN